MSLILSTRDGPAACRGMIVDYKKVMRMMEENGLSVRPRRLPPTTITTADLPEPVERCCAGGTQPPERDRCYGALKPMRACVPSQKGLLREPPQRQSRTLARRSIVRPVPAQTSTDPDTANGPLVCGVMRSVPPLAASGWLALVSGSPLATKRIALWLSSQKGLFFEAPHRHSVARVMRP
jgi:hypothetical protein